jgi:hypothetical protein
MWLTQAYNCGLARAAQHDVDDDADRQGKQGRLGVDHASSPEGSTGMRVGSPACPCALSPRSWGGRRSTSKRSSAATSAATQQRRRPSRSSIAQTGRRMNKVCKTDSKTKDQKPAKCWSGRRESNPRMQLGKLAVRISYQADRCKTEPFGPKSHQRVTAVSQNAIPGRGFA